MSKKAKLVIVYCVLCTVLFIAVFTLFSYTGKLPQTWVAAVFTALYCIFTAFGAFMILKFGSSSAQTDPPKNLRPEKSFFRFMKIPVATTDTEGKITWRNDLFESAFSEDIPSDSDIGTFCGLKINDIINEKSEKGAAVKIGERNFRVFAFPIPYSSKSSSQNAAAKTGVKEIVTFWYDVSDEELYKTQLENERLIVAYIIIDMADNFLSGMQDQYTEAVTSVTKLLNTWADSCKGHLREYSPGKYIMMFYADQLNVMKRNSFPILSEVKKITFGGGTVPMTLSIGIADCCGTVADKCAMASSAMNFALQRGGDQVVIKNDRGAKDEFYGGLSKHDPQLTGLNARRLILQIMPEIKKAGSIYIMGHGKADFDCLASCMGIAKICLSLGKKTTIFVRDYNSINQPYAMMKQMPDYKDIFFDFSHDDFDNIEPDTLLFIMDTNNPEIFEDSKILNHVSSIIIIDHHRRVSVELPQENLVKTRYIEPSASSASEIVAQMLEQFFPSGVLTSDEANLLLAGIMLDTNSFTRDCGAGTYAAAQYLRREGADASEASAFFDLTQNDYKFEYMLGSRMIVYMKKYAICIGDDGMVTKNSASAARVADTMMKIKGISASFVACRVKKNDDDEIPVYTISARSDGSVNVQLILERLGGGGHHSNAGVQLYPGKVMPMLDKPLETVNATDVAKYLKDAIDISPEEPNENDTMKGNN